MRGRGRRSRLDRGGGGIYTRAGAFLMLMLVPAVPTLRLRRTVDAATEAITDLNERTEPLLGNLNQTVLGLNSALSQVGTSLDGVNVQLERLDTITGHAQTVTANVANLATVVTATASSPLVKAAAFSYGIRKAAATRRAADEDKEVRAEIRQRRRFRRGR